MFNVSYSDTVAALLSASNSATGPDGISGSLLRKLAPVLGQPVSIIFQQSLAHGQFSQRRKTTLVVPIYKGKGSRASVSSYCPVSLYTIFGKVLEKIVRDHIFKVVDASSVQHGFSKRRWKIINLLVTENFKAKSLNKPMWVDYYPPCNKRYPFDIISFDFSIAFDKVPHADLLLELNRRGITGVVLRWLRSLLTDRSQIVKHTALSSSTSEPSGVIQGSVLSTARFNCWCIR